MQKAAYQACSRHTASGARRVTLLSQQGQRAALPLQITGWGGHVLYKYQNISDKIPPSLWFLHTNATLPEQQHWLLKSLAQEDQRVLHTEQKLLLCVKRAVTTCSIACLSMRRRRRSHRDHAPELSSSLLTRAHPVCPGLLQASQKNTADASALNLQPEAFLRTKRTAFAYFMFHYASVWAQKRIGTGVFSLASIHYKHSAVLERRG